MGNGDAPQERLGVVERVPELHAHGVEDTDRLLRDLGTYAVARQDRYLELRHF